MSVIYKLQSRIIVVPPGMTRDKLIACIDADYRAIKTLRHCFHPLIRTSGSARLRSPWTLEYADRTPCTLVKP